MSDFPKEVRVLTAAGKPVIILKAGIQNTMDMQDGQLNSRIVLNASNGNLFMRAKKQTGETLGAVVIMLDSATGDLLLGGESTNGGLLLCPTGVALKVATASIHLNAGDRTLLMWSDPGRKRQVTLGADGNLWLGGTNGDGDVVLFAKGTAHDTSKPGSASIHLSAGDVESGPRIVMRSGVSNTVEIDGKLGEIHLQNADCAEEFDVGEVEEDIGPGSVVVLNSEGKLTQSYRAYDPRVAGVVSGAGVHKPGIVLDKRPTGCQRLPVALVGKTFCKVDADSASIGVGDLLTTSDTPGHAMRVGEPLNALGAIIGKALASHDQGRGLIPILVALQ